MRPNFLRTGTLLCPNIKYVQYIYPRESWQEKQTGAFPCGGRIVRSSSGGHNVHVQDVPSGSRCLNGQFVWKCIINAPFLVITLKVQQKHYENNNFTGFPYMYIYSTQYLQYIEFILYNTLATAYISLKRLHQTNQTHGIHQKRDEILQRYLLSRIRMWS